MPLAARSFASGLAAGALLALVTRDNRVAIDGRSHALLLEAGGNGAQSELPINSRDGSSSSGGGGSSSSGGGSSSSSGGGSSTSSGGGSGGSSSSSGGHTRRRRPPLPDLGDLASAGILLRALASRSSAEGEIIFMLTDERHLRLSLNLLLNLEALGLSHHLVISTSSAACLSLWERARPLNLSLGCGWSSFLHRNATTGATAAHDAGLVAYGIEDSHVYHLWWQRWYFLSEAVSLGYRVLSLDTDISLRANPYPLLHGPLRHHSLIVGLDNDAKLRPFYFVAANVGFVYAKAPQGSAAHWVLAECRRRLERIARGEIFPLPSKPSHSSQQMLWDQVRGTDGRVWVGGWVALVLPCLLLPCSLLFPPAG